MKKFVLKSQNQISHPKKHQPYPLNQVNSQPKVLLTYCNQFSSSLLFYIKIDIRDEKNMQITIFWIHLFGIVFDFVMFFFRFQR